MYASRNDTSFARRARQARPLAYEMHLQVSHNRRAAQRIVHDVVLVAASILRHLDDCTRQGIVEDVARCRSNRRTCAVKTWELLSCHVSYFVGDHCHCHCPRIVAREVGVSSLVASPGCSTRSSVLQIRGRLFAFCLSLSLVTSVKASRYVRCCVHQAFPSSASLTLTSLLLVLMCLPRN